MFVSMKDLKLVVQKSHDCHVLMQQLLPVAIRGIAEYDLQRILTILCFFFNAVCSKVFEIEKLDELENEGYLILCQLEKLFLPTFFDIMVHLIFHLVREIKLCGPIHLRWMYPIERSMKLLKGYVKNAYRLEASIVQKYISEEAMEFCQIFLAKVRHIGLPKRQHAEGGKRGASVKSVDPDELSQVHLHILNNVDEVQDSIDAHKEVTKRNKYSYITDQENKIWSVALQRKRVTDIDEEIHSNYGLPESTLFSRGLPDMKEEDEVNNEHGIRNDHHEGIWEDIPL
ncbi:hypothetical protein K1719_017770 [Acacia pycnantha]|nr:hypothetical protein K1719_017770 [Acacia pycnantha]